MDMWGACISPVNEGNPLAQRPRGELIFTVFPPICISFTGWITHPEHSSGALSGSICPDQRQCFSSISIRLTSFSACTPGKLFVTPTIFKVGSDMDIS
jgi:hypothetical protein